jgi:SHS2 domain-containing protein
MTTGHRLVEHTADLALEAWAPDEPALLAEVARAICAILTEDAAIEPRDRRGLELATADADERLVAWINELIFLAVTAGFVVADAAVTLSEGGLRADLAGEAGARARVKTELKAATYHELRLELAPGSARCRVVIDV